MKKISLLLVLAGAINCTAQVTKPLAYPDVTSAAGSETHNWHKDKVGVGFSVVAPSAIAGNKVFTITNDGSGSTNEWGGAITTPMLNLPVAIASTDSLACTPLTSGSLTGMVGLVYRGNCEFGAKALAAQNAGATAVIIVNNIPGGPVGMGIGAAGGSVTIPTIMISQADGQAIANQIHNGQSVSVSFTTWGINATNDLALLHSGLSQWHSNVVPLSQLSSTNGNPMPFKGFDGAFIANVGSADQSNVVLKSTLTFQPTSGTVQNIQTDSFQFSSFPQADSILAVGIPGAYDIHPTTTGTYTTTYDLRMDNSDDFPGNNTMSTSFSVSSDIFCKSRFDFTNNRPISNIGYRYGSTTVTTFIAGNLYYVPVGGHGAVSTQYTLSKEAGANLGGEVSSVYLFKWKDTVVADSMVEAGELVLVGANSINHTAQDTSGQYFTQTILDAGGSNNQVILEANTWYYVAVEVGNTCFLGYDGQLNYLPRTFLRQNATGADKFSEFFQVNYTSSLIDLIAEQPNALLSNFAFDITRVVTADCIDSANYSKQKDGLVASIAFRITPSIVSVNDNIKDKTADIVSFPNPANTTITFDVNTIINSSEIEYTVFDIVGKRMDVIVHKNVSNGNDKLVLDVSKYTNGNYLVLIKSKEGVSEFVKFNVTH